MATPTGGQHLYFRAGGRPIASTSGGVSALGPGIDTRGPGHRNGGYLVGPGSVTAAGRYTIINPAPVADLPTWLLELLVYGHRLPGNGGGRRNVGRGGSDRRIRLRGGIAQGGDEALSER